ncbi:selenocysteine lyase/cysteine desulfurase [Paraburkholderia sp. BL23I1N1]|uniref:aminotransferase class V-fold PLP-dependent enzyme n=1 Tax=Paraburkholderia sp. BL23I1N1 TaxID=1938802 RepID=UPI000E76A684|nr:aminotransferase class V-fold PLP-dependent enzyme [Paraburkholderia sp. BL23I1N1]RKE37566.1 selenocysteine lyase/cysteine desulfurase [Paraburkholderia sp. BL23I1N1]
MLDLARLRADTPGTHDVVHFNNAGASLMPRIVIDTVVEHVREEARLGGYEAASTAAGRLESVYVSCARLLNAQPDEIAVIENATRAWDMAFYSLPLSAGDLVLTSATEYAGNYIPYLQLQKQRGIRIEVIPNDGQGEVSVEALQRRLTDPRVKLVSLPIIATNGGPVQPIEAIGAAAREAGVWFLLDACQGAGHVPLDVKKIGCHMLAATSRKYLRGPRGMGFLYIERALCAQLEPTFLDLHAATLQTPDRFEIRGDARRFENWECNVAAKLGMGAAIDYALELGIVPIWTRIQALADGLRERLAQIDGVTLQDRGAVKSGIVTFTLDRCDAADVQQWLASQARRINVSRSTFQSTMLDMQMRGLRDVVRASVHAYNSDEDIDALVQVVQAMSRGMADAR